MRKGRLLTNVGYILSQKKKAASTQSKVLSYMNSKIITKWKTKIIELLKIVNYFYYHFFN